MAYEEKFRELSVDQNKFNNLDFDIKAIRISIRYIVRIFGVKLAIYILKTINFLLFSSFYERINYIKYLLHINILRLESIVSLAKNDLTEFFEIKSLMCDISINQFFSENLKKSAGVYKNTIFRDDNNSKKEALKIKVVGSKKKEKFYIYGPNVLSDPNSKYKDFTIIFLKNYPGNISSFNKSFLFMNNFYYINVISKNETLRKEVINKYSKCFVSNNNLDLLDGFHNINYIFPQSFLGSLMGLGRILYFLRSSYENIECVIEGFDFYLEKNPYENLKYPKIERLKDNSFNAAERQFCLSLLEHDFMYNFVIIKEILKDINIIDSDKFKEIISLDENEYAKKLLRQRNFSSLLFF